MTNGALAPFEHRRLRVYIAGPISIGNVWENVMRGLRYGRMMLADGLAPMVPHLDAFMTLSPSTGADDRWQALLEWDLEWVAMAEAVFRLAGSSAGADLECNYADQLGIEVFTEDEYDDLLLFAQDAGLRGKRAWNG